MERNNKVVPHQERRVLCVSNLNPTCKVDTVKRYFQKWNIDCDKIFPKDGKSSYCLIVFRTHQEASQALEEKQGVSCVGMKMEISWPTKIQLARLQAVPNLKLERKKEKSPLPKLLSFEEVFKRTPADFSTMFCGNLPQGTTQQDLRELFQGYGEITSINMKVGPAKNKDYCFVRFATKDSAASAIFEAQQRLIDGDLLIDGKKITCNWCRGNASSLVPLSKPVTVPTDALNVASKPTKNHHCIEVDVEKEETIGITNSPQSLIDVDYISTVSGKPHPTVATETACLSCVPLPQPTYDLLLPDETTKPSTGSLSDAQLETIIHVFQHQEHISADGTRPAAFIGDSHGFGKGRIAAGVLFENHLRDPDSPAVWISDSWEKIDELSRDLTDIGSGEQIHVYSLKDISVLPNEKNCVLFGTYSSLTSETQMTKVSDGCGPDFGGVLVFDECQHAKGVSETLKATAVQKLIEKLPKSRILFVSASGMTEPKYLEYLNRIELWSGENKVFADFKEFLDFCDRLGSLASELIAFESKQRGLFFSRQLSFHDVEVGVENVPLDEDDEEKYTLISAFWIKVFHSITFAVKLLKLEGDDLKRLSSSYWAAHLRFFMSYCLSLKVKASVKLANEALSSGRSVIISVATTNNEDVFKSLCVSSALSIIKNFIVKYFPDASFISGSTKRKRSQQGPSSKVARMTVGEKDSADGVLTLDDQDELIENDSQDDSETECHSEDLKTIGLVKEELFKELDGLCDQMPGNAIDDIISQLGGHENVGEISSRKIRWIWDENNNRFISQSRSEKGLSLKKVNLLESGRFKTGEKKVVVTTETKRGLRLHDSSENQGLKMRRLHLLLQLPWSSDQLLRLLGSSHRTDQSSAPEYKFLVLELGGERRFLSTAAKRMEKLYAFRGDRRATEFGELSQFHVDTEDGGKALMKMVKAITGKSVSPSNGDPNFSRTALKAMVDVGLVLKENEGYSYSLISVPKFLKNILGLPPYLQNDLFNSFMKTLIDVKKGRDNFRVLDIGVGDDVVSTSDNFVLEKDRMKIQLSRIDLARGVSWQEIQKVSGFFYKSLSHKKSVILVTTTNSADLCDITRPSTGLCLRQESITEIETSYSRIPKKQAQNLWSAEYKGTETNCWHQFRENYCFNKQLQLDCQLGTRKRTFYILLGNLLSVWTQVEKIFKSYDCGKIQFVRLPSDKQKKVIGILIPTICLSSVEELLKSRL